MQLVDTFQYIFLCLAATLPWNSDLAWPAVPVAIWGRTKDGLFQMMQKIFLACIAGLTHCWTGPYDQYRHVLDLNWIACSYSVIFGSIRVHTVLFPAAFIANLIVLEPVCGLDLIRISILMI